MKILRKDLMIVAAAIMFSFTVGAFSVRGQESTMKKVGNAVTDTSKKVVETGKDVGDATVDTSKKVYDSGKKVTKTGYRKGAVVGERVWTGTKWVGRKSWNGATWVAVKTKNGTKWVYRKARGTTQKAL